MSATTTKRKRAKSSDKKPALTLVPPSSAPAETPTAAASEPVPEPTPTPEHPAQRRGERILRQLAQLSAEPNPRMVLCEAAYFVLQRLVGEGTLQEATVRDLMFEAQAAVLADMLTWVEEQRATARQQQQTQQRPRSQLAQAIERQVAAGRMTASGIALP